MEAALVQRAGIDFQAIPAAGVHGVGLRALPGNLTRLARGLAAARRALRAFRPDVLFFTGGYVGVPVALAGGATPRAVYVPDLEPGLALRLAARRAKLVAVTAEEARRYHPRRRRLLVSGYPVRPELEGLDRAAARSALGLSDDAPVLLVYGGSRGAHSINQAVWHGLPALLEAAQVLHVTGELDAAQAGVRRAALPEARAARYHVHAYLHESMGQALAAADLTVTRAGAATLGELPLFGLPAVLVPYPHAWRYQKQNADHLAGRGAALRLDDHELPARLVPTVLELLGAPARRAAMGEAARALARPGAARAIAEAIVALASGRGGAA